MIVLSSRPCFCVCIYLTINLIISGAIAIDKKIAITYLRFFLIDNNKLFKVLDC